MPSLLEASKENLKEATSYASKINAQGGECPCIMGGWGLLWSLAGMGPEDVPFRDQHQ